MKKIAVVANALVHAVLQHDEDAGQDAVRIMNDAELIFISNTTIAKFLECICGEHQIPQPLAISAVRLLLADDKILADREVLSVCLSAMEKGRGFLETLESCEALRQGVDQVLSFSA